jgi:hypothetical protein
VSAAIQIDLPEVLLLHAKDREAVKRRSQFLLALKYFELGEMSSGQAATMCGLSRVAFLLEAGRMGVPVTELDAEEMTREFEGE